MLDEEDQESLQEHLLSVVPRASEELEDWIVYTLLYFLGFLCPNLYSKLADQDWIPKLQSSLSNAEYACRKPMVQLLSRILQVQELLLSETEALDHAFVTFLLVEIETSRQDEDYNYALIRLLVRKFFNNSSTVASRFTISIKINRETLSQIPNHSSPL